MSWTGSKEFTVSLKSGKSVTAEIEVTLTYDPCYGADADGNRGMPRMEMDSLDFTVEPTDPAWLQDDDGNLMTGEEQKEAQDLLIAKAEDDEWEAAFESRED